MTAMKDALKPNGPTHRLSVGSSTPNFAVRAPLNHSHSHSASFGSLNSANRISRRKSSFSASANSVNRAALVAAARESNARATPQADALGIANLPDSQSYAGHDNRKSSNTSAIVDGPPLGAAGKSSSKSRARRASEGSRLNRERRHTNPNSSAELKSCETCGKSYKHGSCLQKHLWEHTPEWALTSKLLISKHAQVQLLEAASVLVNMTQDKDHPDGVSMSEMSSPSPLASGSSAAIDDEELDSSSRTSTPSQDNDDLARHHHYDADVYAYAPKPSSAYRGRHRQDSSSSLFSRSYQSTAASSMPNEASFYHHHHYRGRGSSSRPSTSASGMAPSYEDELAITAAAEGLVSCSIGTPQFRPTSVHLGDVPPVPPLPAKFAAHASPYLVAQRDGSAGDVDMSDEERRFGVASRVYEDEDGVFGRMD